MDKNSPKSNPKQQSKNPQVSKATGNSNATGNTDKKKNTSLIFTIAGAAVLLVIISIFAFRQVKLNELNNENQALLEEKMFQDSVLNGLMGTFNEFEENLDQIKEREGLINLQSTDPELRTDGSLSIQEDLRSIDMLLQRNEELIAELTAKVEKSDKANRPLRNMIARLRKQLKEREERIVELTTQLASMDVEVDSLNTHITDLRSKYEELIAQQEEMIKVLDAQEEQLTSQTEDLEIKEKTLSTGFYVAGSTKELKAMQVLLSKKKLNTNFDESAFTAINIHETLRIPIVSKKPRLATLHPANSYVFEDTDQDKKIDQLAII